MVDLAEVAESAFAVDPHRRIVYWSEATEKLLGFSTAEVIGRRCCDVLRAGQEAGGACGHCLRPGEKPGATQLVSQFKTQATAHDGRSKQLCVTAVRTHSTEGEVRIMHFLREMPTPLAAPEPAAAPAPAEAEPALRAAEDGRGDDTTVMPAPHLTVRELEVLRLLASGLSTSEIATALSISPITARNHITRVIEKLEVKTRLQAVVTASRQGLL
ncbi:MAG TPA: LuxR C-terminal-related transcriptional regulator [Ktedonobacterales bacterium]